MNQILLIPGISRYLGAQPNHVSVVSVAQTNDNQPNLQDEAAVLAGLPTPPMRRRKSEDWG